MRIVLLRHGETEWNANNLVLGRSDVPLSDKGRKQAEEVGKQLSTYKIDKIYISPLKKNIAAKGRLLYNNY